MKIADNTKTNKVEHGQYFTMINIFNEISIFSDWFEKNYQKISNKKILEPFAGSGNIAEMINYDIFDLYDIEPQDDNIIQQDTLLNFPQGYDMVITNPPYLAKNSATRKGLNTSSWKRDDLYKISLDIMLDNCDYVAVIIPESFITSNYPKNRLEYVISINKQIFEDTEVPVCLALFGKHDSDTYDIYSYNKLLGNNISLSKSFNKSKHTIKFNDPNGNIGLYAVDGTITSSIRFCDGNEIDSNKVSHSSRSVTRIYVDGNVSVSKLNKLLNKLRKDTEDTCLTAFKGLRKDGKYRRRLDYTMARNIIMEALS